MAKAASRRVRRVKTEAQLVAEKAAAIGLPREQLNQGVYRIRDIKIVDNDRTVTLRTLKNMAGNKVEEWLYIGGPSLPRQQNGPQVSLPKHGSGRLFQISSDVPRPRASRHALQYA